MVSPLDLLVYVLCFCVVFPLLWLAHARFGEATARVKILWLAPVVVLPLALYFCLFAGLSFTGWTLGACVLSLVVGIVVERAHLHGARLSIDVPRGTLQAQGGSRLVLLLLLLLDALCYTTLLMLVLSGIPALHTSFFRQFAPELALFSLGSRGTRSWMLSRAWRQARREHATSVVRTPYA